MKLQICGRNVICLSGEFQDVDSAVNASVGELSRNQRVGVGFLDTDFLFISLVDEDGREHDIDLSRCRWICNGCLNSVGDFPCDGRVRAGSYVVDDEDDNPIVAQIEVSGEFVPESLCVNCLDVGVPGVATHWIVSSVEYGGRSIYRQEDVKIATGNFESELETRFIVVNDFGADVTDRVSVALSELEWRLLPCESPSLGPQIAPDGSLVRVDWISGRLIDERGYTVPAGVRRIQKGAFSQLRDVHNLIVPSGVVKIVDGAFDDLCFSEPDGECNVFIKEGAGQLSWVNEKSTRKYGSLKLPGRLDSMRYPDADNLFVADDAEGLNILHRLGCDTESYRLKFRRSECRMMPLNREQFAFVCSKAFDMDLSECDAVTGVWLFSRTRESGRLLKCLAEELLRGGSIEQDWGLALWCCEQAIWCLDSGVLGCPDLLGRDFLSQSGFRLIGELPLQLREAQVLREEIRSRFTVLGGGDLPDTYRNRQDLVAVIMPGACELGAGAFANCRNLKYVYSDSGLIIHPTTFEGCSALVSRPYYSLDCGRLWMWPNVPRTCNLGWNVSSAGGFCGSLELTEFGWAVDGDRWENDADGSFGYVVSDEAFSGCQNLQSVRLLAGNVFYRQPIAIGERAFHGCNQLVSCFRAADPGGADGFISVRRGSFCGCSSLRQVPIIHMDRANHSEDAALIVPESAFEGCEALESVRLFEGGIVYGDFLDRLDNALYDPMDHVWSVRERAFNGCSNLRTVLMVRVEKNLGGDGDFRVVPGDIRRMNLGSRAFGDCQCLRQEGLATLSVSEFSSEDAFDGCQLDT